MYAMTESYILLDNVNVHVQTELYLLCDRVNVHVRTELNMYTMTEYRYTL